MNRIQQQSRLHFWVGEIVNQYVSKGRISVDQSETISLQVNKLLASKKAVISENLNKVELIDLINGCYNEIEDRHLLSAKSPTLIDKYRYQTIAIVRKFVTEDHAHFRYLEFILEDVQGKLLEKLLGKSFDQYKQESTFRTYLYRITNNLVIDELRKFNRRIKTTNLEEATFTVIQNQESELLKQHAELFSSYVKIILQVPEKSRFELCIKAVYRILFQLFELGSLFPEAKKKLLNEMIDFLGKEYQQTTKGVVWEKLTYFVSELEQKKRSTRTLKDWVEKNQIRLMELILQKTISLDSLSQKQAFDEYFELITHEVYANSNKDVNISQN